MRKQFARSGQFRNLFQCRTMLYKFVEKIKMEANGGPMTVPRDSMPLKWEGIISDDNDSALRPRRNEREARWKIAVNWLEKGRVCMKGKGGKLCLRLLSCLSFTSCQLRSVVGARLIWKTPLNLVKYTPRRRLMFFSRKLSFASLLRFSYSWRQRATKTRPVNQNNWIMDRRSMKGTVTLPWINYLRCGRPQSCQRSFPSI